MSEKMIRPIDKICFKFSFKLALEFNSLFMGDECLNENQGKYIVFVHASPKLRNYVVLIIIIYISYVNDIEQDIFHVGV